MSKAPRVTPTDLTDVLPRALGTGTLPEQIHEALEEAIITGVLPPGTRLNSDDLAAHYGVSPTPVREALRSLHEARWVAIRPRYGVYVTEHSRQELVELFETRSVIEGAVARLAAERATADELAVLGEVVARSRAAADEGRTSDLRALGRRFYAALRAGAHNSVLAALSATLEKRARFYFTAVEDDLGGDWVAVHDRLCQLVTARAAEDAARVAADHIRGTGRAVAELMLVDDAS
jgi:DNA-binding GntR family transcriptional regulator